MLQIRLVSSVAASFNQKNESSGLCSLVGYSLMQALTFLNPNTLQRSSQLRWAVAHGHIVILGAHSWPGCIVLCPRQL